MVSGRADALPWLALTYGNYINEFQGQTRQPPRGAGPAIKMQRQGYRWLAIVVAAMLGAALSHRPVKNKYDCGCADAMDAEAESP